MTYRQNDTGTIDTGRILVTHKDQQCPECGHMGIIETVSTEQCEECGHILVDYWPRAK
jgi:ribosomal protein S27E